MRSIAPENTPRRQPLLARRIIVPLAIGLVILLAAVVLSLFVRDFVRQAIVVPVAYIVWLADLVIRSIPQSTFWAVAVVVVVLVAWRNIGSNRAALILRRPATVPILKEHSDRSVFSTRLEYIARMNDSPFAREKLAFELRLLLVKLLSHRERLSENEIERRIRVGELVAPPEAQILLTNWQTWLSVPNRVSPILQLARLWRRLWRLPIRATQPSAAMEQRLLRAIEYMETLMSGGPSGGQPEEKHE